MIIFLQLHLTLKPQQYVEVRFWLQYPFHPTDVSGELPETEESRWTDSKVNGGCHVIAAPILNVPSKCSESAF